MAWRKYLPMSLMAAGAFVLVVGVMGPPVRADKPGTLKISGVAGCTDNGMANDPKPGEQFWVGGANFDHETLYVTITDGTNAKDPVVYTSGAVMPTVDEGTFCVGPITLDAGHYKAYAGPTTTPENHYKTKVFKVSGEPEVPVVTTAPATTTPPVVTSAAPVVTTTPVVTQAPTVTTAVASEGGVVTTAVAAEGGALPATGTGTTMVALGTALVLTGGILELVTRRRPTS